jgi:uncharacterized membrane protein
MMQNRRGRDGEWGNGAIVGVIAAMVIVMVLIAFTLHRNSPLVAGGPYIILTSLLVLVPFQKIQLDGRTRLIMVSGLTAAGYVVLVYLIFFLAYTPVDIDHVRGVQGRYFVIVLPVAAIFVASLINRQLPNGVVPSIAIIGSMISGAATVEALFRVHR